MKNCKKCGMLLEESIEVCIGCGTDVTDPENVSKYPPKMEKKLEAEKKQNKTRTTTIIAIIVVFVLLLALVLLVIFMAPKFSAQTPEEEEEEYFDEDEDYEDDAFYEEEEEEPEVADENRVVKDDEGSYYSRAELTDEGNNLIFTGLYPEDFEVTELSVNYNFCSSKLPGYVTFIVDSPQQDARFFYFSPQHFWNKQSENRSSLASGEDPIFQMTFAGYDDGLTYVESLIKKSYPDAKKVTQTDTWEAKDEIKEQLGEIAKAFKQQIDTHVDYAHIGDDTEYAPMNAQSKAVYYRYEVLTKDKNTLFLQFYVPLISNNIIYSSNSRNDHGTVVEWMALGVYGMVAGNEDLYDDYMPAFQVFTDNCNVNRKFYGVLEARCKDLESSIKEEKEADAPDATKLAGYGASATGSLNEFDSMLYVFTTRRGGDKVFTLDEDVVSAPPDTMVAFLSREKQKVFLSPAEDEYPGSDYEDMIEGDGAVDFDETGAEDADAPDDYTDEAEDADAGSAGVSASDTVDETDEEEPDLSEEEEEDPDDEYYDEEEYDEEYEEEYDDEDV